MKTRAVLKPGQRGTKRLAEKYGADLLCVRFRYDAESRQRLKTIELIADRTDGDSPEPRYASDTLVPLRIRFDDTENRSLVKEAGGRWDPEKKLWFAKYGRIAGTGLEKLIHIETA